MQHEIAILKIALHEKRADGGNEFTMPYIQHMLEDLIKIEKSFEAETAQAMLRDMSETALGLAERIEELRESLAGGANLSQHPGVLEAEPDYTAPNDTIPNT